MSRERLIARAFLSALLASPSAGAMTRALAQETVDARPPVDIEVDEIEDDEILFEADTVMREIDDGPIIAEGDVRAFFGERYLRADRLIYDPATDIVIAEGDVSITDENMETAFAGRVELSGDLRDGIAENFSALLEDNARLAAQSAVQEQGARTRLNRAVYTSCNVCDDEGDAKTPTWRIKALRVTRDQERKVVQFRHAFFELKGVPILYVPFIQGPDPSVERQSGFLAPDVGASSRLGFNFELPYYFAISNHQDATFHPRYTAKDGVLWQGEYRLRGRKGYHVLAGGVIDFDNQETPNEDIPGVRWHYFGRGYREIGDKWRASYDFERVSDDTYLRNYNVERRGDLRQELNRGFTNQLRSNARVAYAGERHRLTIDSYLFQGLRPRDDSSTTPYILPLIDYRHRLDVDLLGGRSELGANIASIYRTGGIDAQRFTGQFKWEKDYISPGGHRFLLTAKARGDVYLYQDLNQGTDICSDPADPCATDFPGFQTLSDSASKESRVSPTLALEWSYPLTREFAGGRMFVEPRVQLIAGLKNRNPAGIINEDSQSIEFDYAGLFDINKSTGFDAVEDGQRANVGVAATVEWDNGIVVDGAIGQQFRVQESNAFDLTTGLGDERSDIVGELNFRLGGKVGIENRFRFDNDFGALNRAESAAFVRAGPVQLNLGYARLKEENVVADFESREEIRARARVRVARHWSVGSSWRYDLEDSRTITQDVQIAYDDECSTFGITYRRNRTRAANLEPDNAVVLTFTLKSLVE